MGAKSLGEQMGIKENDAACYIDSFKSRYTGKETLNINYLLDTIQLSCHINWKKISFTKFSVNISIRSFHQVLLIK